MAAKKKVLLIDDEEDFCFFVSKNLEKTGEFSVAYATNAEKGISMAKSALPDLIVLDILMPGKDGFKALEMLKQDMRTISIPVIVLSALNDDRSKEKAAWLYNESYLAKPVTDEALRREINRVLKNTSRKKSRLCEGDGIS